MPKRVRGAAGLALLVALATAAPSGDPGGTAAVADLADGLRTAMTVGGVASVLGGLLAFTLRGRSAQPLRTSPERRWRRTPRSRADHPCRAGRWET
ncbi:hypothetical protein ACFVW2_02395 [Streptomyces sp. NPDC058171]